MSTARDVKKLAFTCEQCRKRKVKCDGAEPACSRCQARKETCEYKQSPTLIYTHSLEKRIKDLEAELAELRQGRKSTKSPDPRTPESSQLRDDSSSSKPRRFDGLKIDDKGVTTYHGSTSFFHFLDGLGRTPPSTDGETERDRDESKQSLKHNAWQQRAIELNSQIPEPFRYLIDLHWCWVQPLWNFIYRPAFTRDMVVLGPYYSHTLMNALLSHSIRWGRADPTTHELLKAYDNGQLFARHSRDMVFDEVRRGVCTIPTIQTLLLLSAQECSLGNSTQAWIYSGMAFRLVDHLGVSFDVQRNGGSVTLSDEDIEIRRRLFWSCYFWDKVISLYLGRLPSLQQTPVSPPQWILDDSAEDELWRPHGLVYATGTGYTPRPSHSTSCFMQMCRLSVIFNQILIHMYDPADQNSEEEIQECILQEEVALDHWWEDLQVFLKIDTSAMPDDAPPSHIVTLNCLYHTFRILLYRPIFSWQPSVTKARLGTDRNRLQECVSSATATIAIFNLYSISFGESFCTLSLHYAVYIAASVFLLQAQATPGDLQAHRKLEFCIHALHRASAVNIVIGTALKSILKKIRETGIAVHVPTPEMSSMMASVSPSAGPALHDLTLASDLRHGGFDDIDMTGLVNTQGMLQATSSLEPVSVRFTADQQV